MLRIQVNNKRERQQFDHPGALLEFGRGPQRDNIARCVVQDAYVSKDHVSVEELPAGLVRVRNLSQRNSIRLADNSTINTGDARDLKMPVRLAVGETVIEIDASDISRQMLETIAQPFALRRSSMAEASANQSLLNLGGAPTAETLTHWFETVIAVQRAAAGSPEFYDQTARALVDLVGLDRGMVLLRRGGTWSVEARCPDKQENGQEFSNTILAHVVNEARTFYQTNAAASGSESLQGVEAVVASPILDARDKVVGAVYGMRTRFTGRGMGIGPLEAQVVQLLASAAGVGLARAEHEAEATRNRVMFEMFFSAGLARELARNPQLLEGQEREITVLFCDIRGFSRMSEKLGPQQTCRLVAQVMDRLSERIREHEGVVVDYQGDGLFAMWNAPADQPEHAVLASRAALAMQAEMPILSEEWRSVVGGPLRLGIGLNTGKAMVGNMGSKTKFKYGPLGHAVNLASRVEGATKQFGILTLLTGSTKALIGDDFATRRLAQVRVVGINEPVNLYELYAESAPSDWVARTQGYEDALKRFEESRWPEACRILTRLIEQQEAPYDIPCLDLVMRALQCVKSPPEKFDPVMELQTK